MKYLLSLSGFRASFAMICLSAMLTACGGGGGGDASAPTPAPQPAASAPAKTPNLENPVGAASSKSSVASVSSVSSAANSSTAANQAKPAIPTSLQATEITANRVTLVWQAPTGGSAVTGYRLTRNGQVIGSTAGNVTSYIDAEVSPEHQYTYRVQSSDNQGNWSTLSMGLSIRTAPQSDKAEDVTPTPGSSASSVSSASSSSTAADKTAPTTPSGLAASNIKDTSIDLSWNASSDNVGVTLYRVQRNGATIANISGQARAFLDTDLTPNTAYSYRVQAGDAAGNWSTLSSTVTVTTTKPATKGVALNWSHPTERENGQYLELDEIGGYELRYRENSLAPFKHIIIEGSYTTSYSVSDLQANYDFQIAAFDNQGLYSEFVNISAE